MTIEVKQLLIKSTIMQRAGGEEQRSAQGGMDELKAEIMAECREMMLELLQRRKER
jgi:hypothetical protein